jgi:hypothetical protein
MESHSLQPAEVLEYLTINDIPSSDFVVSYTPTKPAEDY